MDFLLLLLGALLVPFVLPIASWVSVRRTRSRVVQLEDALAEQQAAVERLNTRVAELLRGTRAVDAPAAAASAPVVPAPASAAAAPVGPAASAVAPSAVAPPAPVPPAPAVAAQPPVVPRPPAPGAAVGSPRPAPQRPAASTPAAARADAASETIRPPVPPPPAPPRPPSPPPPSPAPAFDWESLVGVKLFSAIAGIALVIAAVFFLRYSVQQGWLQPPVRVLIGIAVAVTLLVLCELKAARKYEATANALDAAAIAILFSTFFAAHALWHLIPASVAFGLLAVVTTLAVILSIRRESLFIAVLGLLGGFATPALLSTGENRPIPLFAYLLLLNVGLAWVAYRQTWPVLTVLTLVLTTIYQWGWVFKFLSQSELSLALGIFLIFPVVTFAALLVARRPAGTAARSDEDLTFERTAMAAAALPILFAAYLAAVPSYGARAGLLFGFLAIVDAGLCAIAIARRQSVLHAAGALSTVVVLAVWLSSSYQTDARHIALALTATFVVLYLLAPVVADNLARPLEGPGSRAVYAAPFLLFVFPVLLRVEPLFASTVTLFGTLLVLLLLCAWRAIATSEAFLYFIAAFFSVAAQAVWSAQYLTIDRLRTAVLLYAVFGFVTAAVPAVARKSGRTLEPEGAGGVMLLASLGLLLYLASGPVAPAALWALALLLAILNAGLFIESASTRLPVVALCGTVFSWIILGIWWARAAAVVGVLPSLAVLTGLTLVTLGGYAWSYNKIGGAAPEPEAASFTNGLYLALIGHLFLFFIAVNRQWALPPWPLFGTLGVITLATSATALATRASIVHVAGTVAAAVIVMAWTASAAVAPWPLVGLAASAGVSLFALLWMAAGKRFDAAPSAAVAAAAALFIAELTVILTTAARQPPPFPLVVAAHVVNLAIVLALAAGRRWTNVAVGAALIGALAVFGWQAQRGSEQWKELLVLSASLYALFTAYPLVVGRRARGDREPWMVALVSAATTFFAARAALLAGGLDWMIGGVPVIEGLVTVVLLRALLKLEPPGQRDLGRLALVAGAALAFVTVAIPLQLAHQWITIGWALEGAALAWLYRRIPHRGLLLAAGALMSTVFVRLALNPEVFSYEPRGPMRILNWYLYTYLIAAAAMFVAAGWFRQTEDDVANGLPRLSRLLPAAGVILLFILLNVEIADYYATGPEIIFRFGVTVSQDLTYTIGWLVFGMALLAAGIYAGARPARIAAVALIAVTACKCFLYDLASLEGLYRVGSLVGLAMSLALVSLALQKYVLARPREVS
jgi:hypothetical protein